MTVSTPLTNSFAITIGTHNLRHLVPLLPSVAPQKRAILCSASSSYNKIGEMQPIDPSNSQAAGAMSSTTENRTVRQPTSYRVSLFDALKVFGPGPERVNGRLAMSMLYFGAKREVETGDTLVQQLTHPDWRLGALAAIIVYATMVPVLKGAIDEDFGIFSVRAEKVNGRVAMLAWAALIALEYLADGACFF